MKPLITYVPRIIIFRGALAPSVNRVATPDRVNFWDFFYCTGNLLLHYTFGHEKRCHFYFDDNFGNCRPISVIIQVRLKILFHRILQFIYETKSERIIEIGHRSIFAKVIVKIKVAPFYGPRCMYYDLITCILQLLVLRNKLSSTKCAIKSKIRQSMFCVFT